LIGYRKAIFYAVVAHGCGGLPTLLAGAMAVQMTSSLDLGISAFGSAIALYYVASAVVSPFSGRLVERIGWLPGLRAAMTLSGLCLIGVALVVRSWQTLVIFMVMAGVAHSMSQISTTLLIASRVPISRQGLAFGIRQSAVPAAMLLGGLAVPVIALTIGWRWAFAFASLAAWSLAVGVRGDDGPQPFRRKASQAPGIGLPPLLCFAATNALGSAAINALVVFFVGSIVASGVQAGTAGLMLALGSSVGFATRLIAGIVADRRRKGRMIAVAAMLALGTVGFLLFAMEDKFLVVPGMVLAYAGGFGWPGLFQLAIVSNYPNAPAYASGITQAGAYAGAAAGPFLFGILVATQSYAAAWIMTGAWTLAGAAFALYGRHLLKREVAAEDERVHRAEQSMPEEDEAFEVGS
jgi:predicted MFS family arabinose efflux permease